MRYLLLLLAACTPAVGSASQASLTTPWTPHAIASGLLGADGVDLHGLQVVSPWEQSGKVTVDGTVIGTNLAGAEDAVWADIDADGHQDVVVTTESGKKVAVLFGPSWTKVVISTAVQRWMKATTGDMNADGRLDIIAGGKVSPATVGWFEAPVNRRTGVWTYHSAGAVNWVMGLDALDVDGDSDLDILLSDRECIGADCSLKGTRWLEAPSWANHPIGKSQGDHKFYDLFDPYTILDCSSNSSYNNLTARTTLDWLTWVSVPLTMPSNVGRCHDITHGDINLDGVLDLALSFSNSPGALSGVVWLEGPLYTTRHEVSGSAGDKYDNLELVDFDGDGDLDIVTSEQVDLQQVLWYENPEI